MSLLRDLELHLSPATALSLEELARNQWQLAAAQAQKEQEAFARQCRETNAIDGMGAVTRHIDAFAYHDWALKMNSYECWKDKGFNKYIDRIAPETKPRSRGAAPGGTMKLQVGWEAQPKRFTKTFAEK